MPAFTSDHRLRHTADEMFNLVADVERYPEFVPMCERLSVRRRQKAKQGTEALVAEMTVGYLLIRETFTSKVLLDRPNLAIEVAYIDGPFRHLDNFWRFTPEGTGCAVHFSIDYEFKSRVLQLLAGAMFDTLFRRMTAAFIERADVVYGSDKR